ncbi:MAG: hypothetical protein GY856_32240 [bacterium]|nr:hypothetical protein [bacterium]
MRRKELLERIGNLIDQTQTVDFSIPEDTGYFSIDDDLVRQVRKVIRLAADLIREIMEFYDVASGHEGEISTDSDTAFLKEIGAQIASQMAVQEVTGLAFVSRGGLLDMQDALDSAIESRSIWKVASCADAGLRGAGRALIALESAIREYEGLPAKYRCWQNIDDALEIRRLYGQFRRTILRGDTPESDELTPRLRRAADRIANLRDLDIYPLLRIDDRLEIRRMQKRILTWLEGEGDHRQEDGERLWEDLTSFARLLAAINHREELCEHDRLAVNGIFRRLFEGGPVSERISSGHLAILEPLLGREDDLDHIILHPDEHRTQDLRAPLERLREELGKPFDGRRAGYWSSPAEG